MVWKFKLKSIVSERNVIKFVLRYKLNNISLRNNRHKFKLRNHIYIYYLNYIIQHI